MSPFLDFFASISPHTLTPAQRVWAMVAIDHVQPSELDESERELCREIFGTDEDIPTGAFDVVALYKGARVGGTYLSALGCLWRAMTVSLNLAPGEQAFTPLVAPDTRLARQSLNYIKGAVEAAGWSTVHAGAEFATVRRADGVENTFQVLPAARAGVATRGRTMTSAHLQEACFLRGDDAVVNDSEVFRSISPRVVRGGTLFIESTPWLESGVLWDLTKTNWGDPTTALAGKAPTLLFREGDEKIARQVEAERERDPENAAREYDCIALGKGSEQWFDPVAISLAIAEVPGMLPAAPKGEQRHRTYAAIDPGFTSDAFAGAIVRIEGSKIRTVQLIEMRPTPGQPLKPSVTIARLAEMLKPHGVRRFYTDVHYQESVKEEARRHDLFADVCPGGGPGKEEVYTAVRDALLEERLEMSTTHHVLEKQLREVVGKPRQGGGFAISSPRRRGRHGDVASAWVLAMWAALNAPAEGVGAYVGVPGSAAAMRWAGHGRGFG